MRLMRRIAVILSLLPVFAAAPLPAQANPYIVVDAVSGKVLAEEDATRPWYPASLTKLMTAYTVFKAIEQGRVDLGTPVAMSKRAASMAPSKMGYPVGTLVTIDDALKMLIVKSANDIAVALAEGVSGSVEGFVDEMNAHSRALGMTQSRWFNPNGLPDARQISSARDMAILARAIKAQFPQHAALFRIHAIKSGKRVMRTHNALVYRYPGTDGMKTGFICASGFNVVASAARGDRRLITVVLGASSARERAERAAGLLEKGFGKFFTVGARQLATLPASRYAEPTDIRESVCGKKRRRAPAEGEEQDDAWNIPGDTASSPLATVLSDANRNKKSTKRLQTTYALDAPIPVGPYKGPRKPKGAAELVAAAAPAAVEIPLPPEPARLQKPGAIDGQAASPAANAYAASGADASQPVTRAGAIGAPVELFGSRLAEGKGDKLTVAQAGQIPRQPVLDDATAPASDAGAEIMRVPFPPPRPKRIPAKR